MTVPSTHKKIYSPKKWDLAGLQGISDGTLEMHFGLYGGYVKNVNLLNERLADLRGAKKRPAAIQDMLNSCGVSASSTTACGCMSITSIT